MESTRWRWQVEDAIAFMIFHDLGSENKRSNTNLLSPQKNTHTIILSATSRNLSRNQTLQTTFDHLFLRQLFLQLAEVISSFVRVVTREVLLVLLPTGLRRLGILGALGPAGPPAVGRRGRRCGRAHGESAEEVERPRVTWSFLKEFRERCKGV